MDGTLPKKAFPPKESPVTSNKANIIAITLISSNPPDFLLPTGFPRSAS
jgi:hypothetical protein